MANPAATESTTPPAVERSERAFWRQLAGSAIHRAAIPLVVTLFFLGALVLNPAFNVGRLWQALAQADYIWLIPAVAIFFVGVWLRAVRWGLLLRPIAAVPAIRLFPVIVLGFAANNVLPARAGELVRVHELFRREGISRSASLATILIERTFDGLTLLLLLGVVSLFVPLADWFGLMLRAGAVIFLVLVVIVTVLALGGRQSRTVAHALVRRLPGSIGGRIEGLLDLFLAGLAGVRSPGLLGLVALTSLAAWVVESGVYLCVMFAFSIDVPAYVALLVTSTANLAITLPSSQGGIGPFEFFAAQTLIAFGVPNTTATAYALVAHAAVLLPVIPLGGWVLWRGLREGRATDSGL
ncbi:MAG: lysylphosphatidylglycerol synthase transmembrane domain-containing protein [Dehalococcoidia bacterium]